MIIPQILDVKPPSKECHVETSDESSDSDDEIPLSLVARPLTPMRETSPPPTADIGDYCDGGELGDLGVPSMGALITRAMETLDNTTEVSWNEITKIYTLMTIYIATTHFLKVIVNLAIYCIL